MLKNRNYQEIVMMGIQGTQIRTAAESSNTPLKSLNGFKDVK